MKKFIKIEWDDNKIIESHTEELNALELIGVIETTKLLLWGNKQIKED